MAVEQRFGEMRPRLLRLAYSELGDLSEAEDIVQEAWLRLERTGADSVCDLDGWLTVVVARLALDALRSARMRRETYVGPWLPEPLLSSGSAEDPLAGLITVLDPDVVWTTDGGGRASAARKPLQGADRVARVWLALRRKPAIAAEATPMLVNGRLGLTIAVTDGHAMVVSFVVEHGRITRIDAMRNPDKVHHALMRARP